VRKGTAGFASGAALGALTAAGAGHGGSAALLGLIAAVLLIVAAAPVLPILHKLPLIGGARPPQIEMSLAGGGKTTEMDPGSKVDVILGVIVHQAGRYPIEDVLINVWVDGTPRIERCKQDGRPYTKGGSMAVADGPYWAESPVRFIAGANPFYFRVRIPAPGNYRAVFLYNSPAFYGGDRHVEDVIAVSSTNRVA
jgi:hypothetical protein